MATSAPVAPARLPPRLSMIDPFEPAPRTCHRLSPEEVRRLEHALIRHRLCPLRLPALGNTQARRKPPTRTAKPSQPWQTRPARDRKDAS